MNQTQQRRWVWKPIVWLLCLAPLGALIYDGFNDNLTANPIEKVTNETGIWTLRLIAISLAVVGTITLAVGATWWVTSRTKTSERSVATKNPLRISF